MLHFPDNAKNAALQFIVSEIKHSLEQMADEW